MARLILIGIALTFMACPKGAETSVEVPVQDTVVVDTVAVDTTFLND